MHHGFQFDVMIRFLDRRSPFPEASLWRMGGFHNARTSRPMPGSGVIRGKAPAKFKGLLQDLTVLEEARMTRFSHSHASCSFSARQVMADYGSGPGRKMPFADGHGVKAVTTVIVKSFTMKLYRPLALDSGVWLRSYPPGFRRPSCTG